MENSQPRLGVTLYSLTPEFLSHRYSFEDLVENVASLGLGPGLEIIGYQAIRGFPRITEELADRFRMLVSECELELSCLDVHQDVGAPFGRLMSDDELVACVEAQIEAARRLGFPLLRLQHHVLPAVIQRLLPIAERADVKLAVDIHAPHTVHHPYVAALVELRERLGSEHVGFIPDFAASATRIPPLVLDHFRSKGMPEQIVAVVEQLWQADGDPFKKQVELQERVRRLGGDEATVSDALSTLVHFGRQEPRDWSLIMPYVMHVHAKCYEFDADGNELAIPYGDLLQVLVDGGFGGYLSTGYEAFYWAREDGFAMVATHHDLCRRILATMTPPEPKEA
jgi:hypothetical protein